MTNLKKIRGLAERVNEFLHPPGFGETEALGLEIGESYRFFQDLVEVYSGRVAEIDLAKRTMTLEGGEKRERRLTYDGPYNLQSYRVVYRPFVREVVSFSDIGKVIREEDCRRLER
jgi:hypothetical protein